MRLQNVIEDVLPDSQCSFRSGRGCVDMIFCAQQLIKKARENKMYMLFVDLCKVYDSVPRQSLWMVLHKYGILSVLVKLIQSLHEGMKEEATVEGSTTPVIEVNNGLLMRHGSAPRLQQ